MFLANFIPISVLLAQALAAPLATLKPANITYKGYTDPEGEVESFLNIKFAQDTSGFNRFRRPIPFQPEPNSTVDATVKGAACPQRKVPVPGLPFFHNVTNISEDCLTLRISRPANLTDHAKLPVMVWIYGGGDTIGQIYDELYDPTNLVKEAAARDAPIIYAAVNYRVTAFGFAASPALADEGNLNAALLDQRLGIEWIRENIATFGGDPGNITIFGESDGATNVGLQLTAYGGKRHAPFKRAIMESGSPAADPGVASQLAWNATDILAELTNCTSQNGTNVETLKCLRSLPMEVILEKADEASLDLVPESGFETFLPTVDEDFIPEAPSKMVREGHFYKDIDVIVGWNENDGTMFVNKTVSSDAEVAAQVKTYYPGLTDASISYILDLYQTSDFSAKYGISAQYYRLAQIWRDAEFVCPSIVLANQVHQYGARSYLFDLNQTLYDESDPALRADCTMHTSDLPYVFDTASTYKNTTQSDDELANNMSNTWVMFAHTGSVPGSLSWPQAYESAHNVTFPETVDVRVLGGHTSGVARVEEAFENTGLLENELLLERCFFWTSEKIFAQLRT
ncbi:alpha/beta-hydrolase [Xylona heveae TC161]|uniref:Alpha/beta-hydrolase n=1 Tax=Xylona heveae (strain CBS 132557 / TC161) TaxID=1328760 RepID=A0A165GPF2_XYLHT|nr:alpha/beta-hydrolase [Xylona heveae TC161]KZF22433.1 alpha/beta-hydrolase [Xylona heveae TC161]